MSEKSYEESQLFCDEDFEFLVNENSTTTPTKTKKRKIPKTSFETKLTYAPKKKKVFL